MATFRKIGEKWRVEVARHGIRKSKYCSTKAEAQAWARETETKILSGRHTNKTLYNALDRYRKHVSIDHKGERWEALRINLFKRQMADRPLSEITPDIIAKWRDARRNEVSKGSVRREMSLLGAIFSKAAGEWEWIENNPFRRVERPPPSKHRDRVITHKEQEEFFAECRTPSEHEAARAFKVALETGMRASEILRVKVNGKVGILTDSKNNDERQVPLTVKARELLQEPIALNSGQLDVHFRNVRDRLKQDYKFHDSRHTAATRIGLEAKITPYEMCQMFGWRNLKYALIYFNTTASAIADRL